MIDLHSHSRASDGTLSPSELIKLAAQEGLKALALTDHDTLDGLEEAEKAASQHNIIFIPGIELEIEHRPGEFHLLGLGLTKWRTSSLLQALKEIRQARQKRNEQIMAMMNQDGLNIKEEDLRKAAGGQIIARPHFARVLVEKNIAKNIKQAFDRFLSAGMKYYAPRQALALDRAIHLIHEAGGKAVLAHPLSLYVSWGKLPLRLASWREQGLDGIEAWHSGASERQAMRLETMGRECGLFITGGSDFHGSLRKDRFLGRGAGKKPIRDAFLEPFCRQ